VFGVITVIQRVAPTYAKLITVVLTLTFAILAFPLMRSYALHCSTVILRYSWDQAERREDRNEKIKIGAFNAVIGFVLGGRVDDAQAEVLALGE